MVIPPDEIKAGNWISLKYPGSLIAAHKVLEVREYGVVIEKEGAHSFIKAGNNREYPELLRTQVVDFRGIKGIPLTCEILESCGFKMNDIAILKGQSGTEDSISTYYSDEHLFMLHYQQGPRNIFTHASNNSNIEFVHQLQNLYSNCMNRELEISIEPFNFQYNS